MIITNHLRWKKDKETGERVLQQWFMAEVCEPFKDYERSFTELRHPGGFWIDVPEVSDEQ